MKLLAVFAAVLLLAGCDTNSQPDYRRVAGVLALDAIVETISVPDDVRVGQSVAVTVTTQGGGCERQADTEVTAEARMVVIRPYDETDVSAEACTEILAYFPHTVLVTFPEAGETVVRAIGRGYTGAEAIVERTVTVLPR